MCLCINAFISLLCVAFNFVLSHYFRQTSESKLKYEKICDERKASDYAVFSIVFVLTCVCSAADVHRSSRDLSVMTMSTLQSKWTQRILQQIPPLLTLKQPIREQDAMRDACPTRNRYSFNIKSSFLHLLKMLYKLQYSTLSVQE